MDRFVHRSLTTEDIEDTCETVGYPETDTWTDYEYENEYEEDKYETTTEEDEGIPELEMANDIDMLASFMTEFETKRAKELAVKAEEKKKQLRHLIGVREKRDKDASEETLLTPEEEMISSEAASMESSIHPCLRDIDISDSRLKLVNPYTVYPTPDDPGLVPAFLVLYERPPVYRDDGIQKFYDAVKRSGLRPIGPLKDMLVSDDVNLRYYGINSQIVKAMCEALESNTFVRKVDLKDNKLSVDACRRIKSLLLKNNLITSLSLSGCRIGAAGAKQLHDAILANATLKTLDLSKCDIGNEGFGCIAPALSINKCLQSVNLSDNRLDESCSEHLQDVFSCSESLTHLDVSWNSLYSATIWKALTDGLERNETLRSLNLSWNGLGGECVPYLYQLLSNSQSIRKLELSWNGFIDSDAVTIAKALSKNNTLQELYLGNNPLKPSGALSLVRAITSQLLYDDALRILDLENVWANKEILQELETIKNLKPWFIAKLGGVLSNYHLVGPDPRKILLKRANYEAMMPKRKKQRRNFGQFVMSLEDKTISRAKFIELIQKFKLKFSMSLITEIMNVFEESKNTVNQQLLKSFYLKEYPEVMAASLEQQATKENKVVNEKKKTKLKK